VVAIVPNLLVVGNAVTGCGDGVNESTGLLPSPV